MGELYEKLRQYRDSDYYGFHMPGHKRNTGLMENDLPYGLDITEIEGFDDLHHAEGILKEAQERAAVVYHADETCFLVNGSTVGLLSAVMGSVSQGGKVLVARNCHRCVYHAIEMQELYPVYLYPDLGPEGIAGEIDPGTVQKKLQENPEIQAVVIVSPTYDGVVSDVKAIADIAHEQGIPLIVDEAHGAHFGFHPYFPKNANEQGADLVIHSLHKTMPALTQTALLHLNGKFAEKQRVRHYLDMLQSSSPSYLLMAGIDECLELVQKNGKKLFCDYINRLDVLRSALKEMKWLHLLETPHYDRSKILISTKGCKKGAKEIYKILLNDYHLQMEMVSDQSFLAMTSVADTEEGLERLRRALLQIDAEIDGEAKKCAGSADADATKKTEAIKNIEKIRAEKQDADAPELIFTSGQMQRIRWEQRKKIKCLAWKECTGAVSAEYAYLYPPGIPLLVPGERVTKEIIERLQESEKSGNAVHGTAKPGFLEVWSNG